MDTIVSEQLTYFLEQNPAVAKTIVKNPFWPSVPGRRPEKARRLNRRKTALEG